MAARPLRHRQHLNDRLVDLARRAVVELAAGDRKVRHRHVVMDGGAGLGVDVNDIKAHVPLLALTVGSAALVAATQLVPLVCAVDRAELRPDDVLVVVAVHARHLPVARIWEVMAHEGVEVDLVVLGQLFLEVALGEGGQVCLNRLVGICLHLI